LGQALNKWNYHDWYFELKNLCRRKNAEDEEAKFSWLVETLNTSDKRLIMKHETGKLTMRKTFDGVEKVVIIDGLTKPFTWAVETLKKLILENNAESKDEVFKLREKMKDNLKNVKIS
jgi:hypothetical protein